MWIWIVIGTLFLFLVSRQLHENTSTTRSRPLALLGTLADGLGLLALGIGTFGMLMAIFLGFFPPAGPHLTGSSLVEVIIWSVGLLVVGVVMLLLSVLLRRAGGRGTPDARPVRGGH